MRTVDAASACTEAGGWRSVAPALAMLLASVLLVIGLSVRLPQAGSQTALVFSPGISSDQAIGSLASVDARIVRSGGLDNIVIAYFERPVSWVELRRLGVVLPLDPIVAGGCAARSPATPSRPMPTASQREWT